MRSECNGLQRRYRIDDPSWREPPAGLVNFWPEVDLSEAATYQISEVFSAVPATGNDVCRYYRTRWFRGMSDTELRPPVCPNCGRAMLLKRVDDRAYGRIALHTFECIVCQVWYTRGEPEGDGAKE